MKSHPVLKWGVSLALLAFVLLRADLSALGKMFFLAQPLWLALAVLLTFLTLHLDAWKLSLLMGQRSPGAPAIVSLNYMGSFWSNLLPGSSVGGDLFRIHRLSRAAGSTLSAGAALLVDRVSNLWIHALVLMALFPFYRGIPPKLFPWVLFAGLALLLLVVVPFVLFRWILPLLAKMLGILPVSLGGGEAAREVFKPFVLRLSPRGAVFPAILAHGILLKVAGILIIVCLSRALGGDLDFFQATAAGFVGTLAGFIPFSIGGWGISETAFFLAFRFLQETGERGLGVALGLRFCLLLPSLLGLVIFLREKRRPQELHSRKSTS